MRKWRPRAGTLPKSQMHWGRIRTCVFPTLKFLTFWRHMLCWGHLLEFVLWWRAVTLLGTWSTLCAQYSWLTFLCYTSKHWIYSSLFVHLNSIARPSLNTMKLLAYYIKTSHFWEGFVMWSIKGVKSLTPFLHSSSESSCWVGLSWCFPRSRQPSEMFLVQQARVHGRWGLNISVTYFWKCLRSTCPLKVSSGPTMGFCPRPWHLLMSTTAQGFPSM